MSLPVFGPDIRPGPDKTPEKTGVRHMKGQRHQRRPPFPIRKIHVSPALNKAGSQSLVLRQNGHNKGRRSGLPVNGIKIRFGFQNSLHGIAPETPQGGIVQHGMSGKGFHVGRRSRLHKIRHKVAAPGSENLRPRHYCRCQYREALLIYRIHIGIKLQEFFHIRSPVVVSGFRHIDKQRQKRRVAVCVLLGDAGIGTLLQKKVKQGFIHSVAGHEMKSVFLPGILDIHPGAVLYQGFCKLPVEA